MIDLPLMPKPKRRLRKGFGCLAVMAFMPMAFGCLNILANKLGPWGVAVVFSLLVLTAGAYIWLARQRA
ncbi:hypothetical protein [Allorhizocola rhizosphaerae]|uniref:hypothetical protein n=1 Tax=Allorhizocola rhizosphaerae TaxID=1872709 RepID=UPI000E3D9D30|nr:hypothetical protein [Allorhizocola rhizosphaerae]